MDKLNFPTRDGEKLVFWNDLPEIVDKINELVEFADGLRKLVEKQEIVK